MSYDTLNKGAYRAGRVIAPDSKHTGEEPQWVDWEKLTKDEFLSKRQKAQHFYNYYLEAKDFKLHVVEWMSRNGYDAKDIKLIEEAPSYIPNPIAGKLARCFLKGMPEKHKKAKTNDGQYLRNTIAQALIDASHAAANSEAKKNKADKPVANPVERLRQKVLNTVVGDLDGMLDKWIMARDEKVQPLNLFAVMEAHDTAGAGCVYVKDWIDRVLNELKEAQAGKDEQLAEAYAYLGKGAMKSRIDGLEKMKADVMQYEAGKKALRKPRRKKAKSAEKQVSKIKYLPNSKEYGLTSISPLLIPGCHHLFVFNVKYKALMYYTSDAPAGLTMKGTTIKGFDEKSSYCTSLRKPEVVLPTVLGKTLKQIEKVTDELTTKKKKANGRINSDTVLLREFNTK